MIIMKDDLHLIILSGQSNMSRMPLHYFSDEIYKRVGTNNATIVKYALGGRPISLWDKSINGWIYDILIKNVKKALEERKDMNLKSVTFVWAQGASDVIYGRVDDYEASFNRVMDQLKRDLDWEDINLVSARMNDWGKTAEWRRMRDLQEKIADDYGGHWVDTDDCNGVIDDLHDTVAGYKLRAKRYADVILNYDYFKD